MNRIAVILLGTFCVSAPAAADPVPYDIDTNHSRLWFDVSHQGFSIIKGMFREFGGSFMFDADDPTASSLNISISANSIDMFHDGLNNHLKTDDFFGVETHPELTFVSTSVEVTGENELAVHGELTMIGETHPVTLSVTQNRMGEMRGVPTVGFSATASLDRTDYGMNFAAPGIGAEVGVQVEFEARMAGGAGGMGMGMGMGQ